MTDMTAKLRGDHEVLIALVSKFEGMISAPVAPEGIELLKFRHAFSRQLLAHLAQEDIIVYPTLRRSKNAAIARTAESFIAEMGGLVEAYKQWSMRWPTERITLEWPWFVEETSWLLNALSKRIARENRELYPLVECEEAIAA